MLVETHWGFTNDYRAEGWLLVHSGQASKKGGGILIGVRQDLVDASTLKWQELHPGRMLHVRCTMQRQQLDVLGIYQHALAFVPKEQQLELMKQRRSLWTKLDKMLAGLPFRTSIFIMGDLNMVLQPMSEVAGPGIAPGNSVSWLVEEREHVMQLLQRHRLTALNTWRKSDCTYHHPGGNSQIDYIAVRKQMADMVAKRSSTVQAPVGAWRSSGHKPVTASVKLNWRPWSGRQSSKDDKRASCNTPSVQQVVSDPESTLNLEQLHLAIKKEWVQCTDAPSIPLRRNVDREVIQLWRHRTTRRSRQILQNADNYYVESIFEAWRRAMLKQKMKRELRALARGRRREALLQALDLTEQAYQAGDIRKHYQLIRRIAPRSYRRKICLRSEEGVMLSNEEECLALAKYAQKLFSGVTVDVPELIALPQEWFTASGWKCALTKLQNHKAVPKHAASIVSWKSHADHLAPALQQLADDTICKSEPSVPEMWTRVQLAWLPKPGRAPNSPEVLRSIGLMGPDTKAFLMILKQNANPWVQQALRKYPQYAYRGLASTNDALLRATLHCSTVRHRMEGCAEDHTAKILGQAKRELIGGLMVGLDLNKAFDLLSHQEMLLSLRDSGMPEGLCRILLHIHVQTQLTIEHAGCSRTIRMSRGLRQGCCVAPMIYACWTIRLCKLLDARMQSAYPVQTHEQGTQDAEGTWTQNHMSLFADDKHCHWDIRSYSDLTVALHQLTLVIETITELGMRINFQKCLATVALKGFRQLRASKSIFRQWNGVKCLMLRHDHHNIYIPTAEQMPYLGAILSYGNFELATAKHRAAQATANFGQLRSVLRTNGPLSQARRLSVYKLCVWSALVYGIVSTGITASACRLLQSTAAMQLRKLLRIYTAGHSNASVLQQAGLPLLQCLQQRVDSQDLTFAKDSHRSVQLCRQEVRRHQHIKEQLRIMHEQGLSSTLSQQHPQDIAQIPCPVCGVYYSNAAGLHQHIHQRHPEVEQASKIEFRRSEHSLFGLPFCRFCRCRQGTWSALIKHITQGMCLRLKIASSQQQTMEQLMQDIIDEEHLDPPRI